jgi:hypothetical protein
MSVWEEINMWLLFLLLFSTSVFAQDTGSNWSDVTQVQPSTPTTTTFSVEIPNADVNLVIDSLCTSTGSLQNCTSDEAKQVIIQFINDQVVAYQKSLTKTAPVDIQ